MAASVIATGWFPLLSINSLPSKNYNEGWNAYRQWMTLAHQPLYGTHYPFWTTNYAFLSFHIIGLLGATKENLVLTGRVVSFASLVAVAWLVGAMVRQATGSRAGALFAALALFAGLRAFSSEAGGVDDPELLSAAFASLGIFAYLAAPRSRFWTALAAIAFCLSVFTKHDYIAFPFSVTAHLVWRQNWRGLATLMGVAAVMAGGLLGLSFHTDGRNTIADLLQPRAYSFANLVDETLHYLLHFAIPLGIGVLVLSLKREIAARGFLLILLLATNVAAIAFAGGDGVANNIFYPPIIADLLACVIGICWLQQRAHRVFSVALLVATFGLAVPVPSRVDYDIQAMMRLPAATMATRQAVGLLEASDGPAICEDLLLCFQAGKPLDYDPYYVKDQILIGHVRDASVVALLNAHHYGAIQVSGAVQGTWQAGMHSRFTQAFEQSLLATYRPILIGPFYVVLGPSNNPLVQRNPKPDPG
jgi:hypothetical protein